MNNKKLKDIKYINTIIKYIIKVYNKIIAIPKDKLLHICIGAIITATLKYIFPTGELFAIVTCIFLVKEMIDYVNPKSHFDYKDLIADYIGFIIGYI